MREKRKRTRWQRLLWILRHPWLYSRANLQLEYRKRRILQDIIDEDYRENKKYYDREFEKQFKKEWNELINNDDDDSSSLPFPGGMFGF